MRYTIHAIKEITSSRLSAKTIKWLKAHNLKEEEVLVKPGLTFKVTCITV